MISTKDINCIFYYIDTKLKKNWERTHYGVNLRIPVSDVNFSSTKSGTDFSSVLTSWYLQFWMFICRSIGSSRSWWSFQPEQGGFKHNLESSFFPHTEEKGALHAHSDTGEWKELMYALFFIKMESKWFLSLKEWLLNVHDHKKIQGKLY